MGKMYRYPHDYCPYCYHKSRHIRSIAQSVLDSIRKLRSRSRIRTFRWIIGGFPCAATAAVSCESAAPTMPAGIKTTSFRRNPLLW